MVELVGDICEPSFLKIPTVPNPTTISGLGLFFISGSELYFHTGTALKKVTSA